MSRLPWIRRPYLFLAILAVGFAGGCGKTPVSDAMQHRQRMKDVIAQSMVHPTQQPAKSDAMPADHSLLWKPSSKAEYDQQRNLVSDATPKKDTFWLFKPSQENAGHYTVSIDVNNVDSPQVYLSVTYLSGGKPTSEEFWKHSSSGIGEGMVPYDLTNGTYTAVRVNAVYNGNHFEKTLQLKDAQ